MAYGGLLEVWVLLQSSVYYAGFCQVVDSSASLRGINRLSRKLVPGLNRVLLSVIFYQLLV